MLHLVIITPAFAINEQDSISLPFLQLYAKELLKNNVKLSILCEQYPDGGNYTWFGADVYTLKRKTPSALYRFLRTKRLKKTLTAIHRKAPISVIHNMWYNILGMISEEFALAHHIKHVITVCGQDVLPENPFLKNIQSYSGTLICPSTFQKNKLLEKHEVAVRVIHWGIEDIQASHAERNIDLIQCGWINAVKNNFLFLDIVQTLKETNLIKKVLICGGGPLFEELQQKIERMHLSDVIELKNSIPRQEVLGYMQQSKILVHTSHFESFGLVMAEALACNCRVIASPVGIAFDHKNILQAFNKEDFISKISVALKKENEKTAFVNDYPISKTVAEHLTLYSEK